MPYGVIFMSEVLPTLITVAGSVSALWIISRTWLQHKQGQPAQNVDLDSLAEAMEQIQHSIDDLRDDVGAQVGDIRELSGRIEFAERLLEKPKE
jgi:hypothetical protein